MVLFNIKYRFELNFFNCMQKRFKFKKKWAAKKTEKTSTELALSYFDFHMESYLQSKWPSVRIALLSKQKYCALLNNYCSNIDETILKMAEMGAFNFIEFAEKIDITANESLSKFSLINLRRVGDSKMLEERTKESYELEEDDFNFDNSTLKRGSRIITGSAKILPEFQTYMPSKRIFSEQEIMIQKEIELNKLQGSSSNLNSSILPWKSLILPRLLKPMTFTRGDVSSFKQSKVDPQSKKISYYLMDGSSILPVIALDLFPGCNVLDMCSAPGGKSLAILQTMLPEKVVCLDQSYNRLLRLKETIRNYLPTIYQDEEKLLMKHVSGSEFAHANPKTFDRVLVDIPCYADRHALNEDDNNLFKKNRQQERIMLQMTQQDLLFSAIVACKPGGLVVYSTCTLSPTQNDGTIEAVFEKILNEGKMQVALVDTGIICETFNKTFDFHEKLCKYGQLVLPNLTANFGPTYFSVIKRIL